MTDEDKVRTLFGFGEKHELPSGYWQPQPDEEDLERMRKEYEENHKDDEPEEPLPFC